MIKKNKKLIEIGCFLLVIGLFTVIGYFTYQSYLEQKEDKEDSVELDNYYSEDYLFNNDYIKKANTIDDFSVEDKDIYMYLDAENVLYIKYTNDEIKLNKHVSNLPEGDVTVYYNNLYDNYYEFIALTKEKEIFYIEFDITSKEDYSFEKIGENIDDVYVPTYDKKMVFVNNTGNFITNFIFVDSEKKLKYIDKEDNYLLKSDFERVKPYFDYVCSSGEDAICSDMMIYQTFENKLMYKNKDFIIKDESDKDIIVKDMFSTFEVKTSNDIDLEEYSFVELREKFDFVFSTYIVDNEGFLYKFEVDNKNVTSDKEVNAVLYSSDMVKELKYVFDNEEELEKVQIIYMNGKEEQIFSDNNKSIITSTVYDKAKEKENETIIPSV